jgi:ABC-2 type transport system permease protein
VGPTVPRPPQSSVLGTGFLPVLTTVLIALSAVGSLITIISIYREGGILKRLRATPLQPTIILSAHVVVKLLFTAGHDVPDVPCRAPLLSAWRSGAIRVVRVRRPVRDVGDPVDRLRDRQSGADGALRAADRDVHPVSDARGVRPVLPDLRTAASMQILAKLFPMTYAVSLLSGIWKGESWPAHAFDVVALVATFVVCIAISSKVFRWE